MEGSIWIWVVIGVIIAGAAGFLIYMLMPPSGYHPKYGYKKQSIFTKIRGLFKRKGKGGAVVKSVKKIVKGEGVPETSQYAEKGVKNFYEGYEYQKQAPAEFGYQQQQSSQRGVFDRIKSLKDHLKRKR